MIPHRPPPPPHPHVNALPPPRQLHSQGDTDVSYTAYSPSPSSLAVHRQKWARIRDWRTQHPHVPHLDSAGVGSANWSDTGTGLDEGQTDIGTIPTTVRVDRELREEDTIGPNKRDRVDPRRHIGSQQSRARQEREDEQEIMTSELPYRQTSQRRNGNGAQQPSTRPPARQDTQHTAAIAPAAAQSWRASAAAPPAPTRQPSHAQRPPLVHTGSKSKTKPTPQLARPPATAQAQAQVLPPDTPLVTSPEGLGGPGGPTARPKDSPFAIREAYLNSALNLPLDMLAQVERERPQPTSGGKTLKPTRSQSSLSSGITTGRLASLMGTSRGPSPNGAAMKRVVSDTQAQGRRASGQLVERRESRADRTNVEAVETLTSPEPPRHAGSNTSARTAKPASQIQQHSIPARPNGIAKAAPLPRSVTAPVTQPVRPSPPRPPHEPSALGLTLGSPAPAITISGPSDPPSSTPIPVQPAPHRQLMALRRPALTPRNSTDNLAQTLALGRKLRDPSMSDLRTRFEPATYPLPESQSSATKSQTSGSGKAGTGDSRVPKQQQTKTPALGSRASQKQAPKVKAKAPAGPTALDTHALISALQPQPAARATSKGHTPWPSPQQPDMPPAMSSSQTLPTPVVASVPIPIGVAGEMLGAQQVAPRPADVPASPSLDSRSPPAPAPAPQALIPPQQPGLSSATPDETLSSPPPTCTTSYPDAPPHAHIKDQRRVNRIREDDDRVSFEVPNGARGRLRVSLAWFRDRGGRGGRDEHGRSPVETPPPPLPPKPSRHGRERQRERDPIPDQFTSSGEPTTLSSSIPPPITIPPRRPSPAPFTAPVRVSTPLRPVSPAAAAGPDPRSGFPPFDPFRPHATVPAYRPPFQLPPHPFAYPQPHPPWASHSQLPTPHVQFQSQAQAQAQAIAASRAQAQAQVSRRPPPAPESVDPPSAGNTPPAPPMGLPSMTMGPMGPMGLQSGMIHPFPGGKSLHPAAQSRVGFQGQGQTGYGGRQPIWKRMFNPRSPWQHGNDNDDEGGGSQDGYPQQRWGGNDRIGNWMRGITPGRAPPLRAQTAPATAAEGYLNIQQQQGRRRNFNLTRPFFQRQQDPYGANLGGGGGGFWSGQTRPPRSPDMYGHLDLDSPPQPRRSMFRGPRQGGMFDRMFTPLQRVRTPGELYSTGQPRPTTAFDARDRYKEARRREKADRRNARAQGRYMQPRDYSVPPLLQQTQRQQRGGGGGMRNWVIRLGNNGNTASRRNNVNGNANGNAYGYGYGPQPNGGRKLSRSRGRWSDRLPRSSNRRGYGDAGARGQRVYATNTPRDRSGRGGGMGMGMGRLGDAFRR